MSKIISSTDGWHGTVTLDGKEIDDVFECDLDHGSATVGVRGYDWKRVIRGGTIAKRLLRGKASFIPCEDQAVRFTYFMAAT
jgi:hypothetical protein